MHSITLPGDCRSKKNSKRRLQRGKKVFMLPSEAHEAWEQEQLLNLIGEAPLQPPYRAVATFYPGTRRKFDLSNHWESVADCLVKAGILTDDNCEALPEVILRFGGVDKLNPRVEILIESGS